MRRGFTAVEMVIVLLVMAISASIACDAVAEYDASARPDRGVKECLATFRYARQVALSSGKSTKITFDTTNNAFSVYWMSNGSTWDTTPMAYPLAQSGSYTINVNTGPGTQGTTLSLSPAGTTVFTFNALGNLDNSTTITFSYGGKSKQLIVNKSGTCQAN